MADARSREPVVDGSQESAEGALAALSALGPEAGALVDLDPALFGRALAAVAAGVARHPAPAAQAGLRCALDLTRTSLAAASRAARRSAVGPVPMDAGDRRFSDPAWEENAGRWTRQVLLRLNPAFSSPRSSAASALCGDQLARGR